MDCNNSPVSVHYTLQIQRSLLNDAKKDLSGANITIISTTDTDSTVICLVAASNMIMRTFLAGTHLWLILSKTDGNLWVG